MIRDPSDGSVREPNPDTAAQRSVAAARKQGETGGLLPVIGPATSGLQTGSSKPENLARLEKARKWIRDYRAWKIKQTRQRQCPKCGKFEVYGKDGELCCLACGAHQRPAS